jgi:flotillin
MSAPLSQVDKITIISTGDGEAAGAHKITGDMAKMAAQVPALFEALSGMKMSDLLSRVQTIKEPPPAKLPIKQPEV